MKTGLITCALLLMSLEYFEYSKLKFLISMSISCSSVKLIAFQNFLEKTLLNPSTSPLFHGLLGATYSGFTPRLQQEQS